jgi:hypothetical protein
MTVIDKDFKVKNGLNVAGNATIGSNLILGNAPIAFDPITNRLQIYINDTWQSFSFVSDIGFMDIGLSIDYNGQPVYTVQGNGVTMSDSSKFVEGGSPATSGTPDLIFDSGTISV